MVEVPRHSTFPPILKSYNPAITASLNPSSSLQRSLSPAKPSQKVNQLEQVQETRRSQPQATPAQSTRGGKKRRDGGTVNQKAGSSSGLLSADKIRKEVELELRRKRNQAGFDKLKDTSLLELCL